MEGRLKILVILGFLTPKKVEASKPQVFQGSAVLSYCKEETTDIESVIDFLRVTKEVVKH